MKRYFNFALVFAVYGLLCGVYYREFTKIYEFSGTTNLSYAHPHVLLLGLLGYIVIAVITKIFGIKKSRLLNITDYVYMAGIIVSSVIMLVRGSLEVTGFTFTSGINGMLSGIAGIGHMLTAAGIILYLIIFRKNADK